MKKSSDLMDDLAKKIVGDPPLEESQVQVNFDTTVMNFGWDWGKMEDLRALILRDYSTDLDQPRNFSYYREGKYSMGKKIAADPKYPWMSWYEQHFLNLLLPTGKDLGTRAKALKAIEEQKGPGYDDLKFNLEGMSDSDYNDFYQMLNTRYDVKWAHINFKVSMENKPDYSFTVSQLPKEFVSEFRKVAGYRDAKPEDEVNLRKFAGILYAESGFSPMLVALTRDNVSKLADLGVEAPDLKVGSKVKIIHPDHYSKKSGVLDSIEGDIYNVKIGDTKIAAPCGCVVSAESKFALAGINPPSWVPEDLYPIWDGAVERYIDSQDDWEEATENPDFRRIVFIYKALVKKHGGPDVPITKSELQFAPTEREQAERGKEMRGRARQKAIVDRPSFAPDATDIPEAEQQPQGQAGFERISTKELTEEARRGGLQPAGAVDRMQLMKKRPGQIYEIVPGMQVYWRNGIYWKNTEKVPTPRERREQFQQQTASTAVASAMGEKVSDFKVPSWAEKGVDIEAIKDTKDIDIGIGIDKYDQFKILKVGDRGSLTIEAYDREKYSPDTILLVNPNDFALTRRQGDKTSQEKPTDFLKNPDDLGEAWGFYQSAGKGEEGSKEKLKEFMKNPGDYEALVDAFERKTEGDKTSQEGLSVSNETFDAVARDGRTVTVILKNGETHTGVLEKGVGSYSIYGGNEAKINDEPPLATNITEATVQAIKESKEASSKESNTEKAIDLALGI